MTKPPGDSTQATTYANSWLATAGQQISAGTGPDSTDSLLARYFLGQHPCAPPGRGAATTPNPAGHRVRLMPVLPAAP